VLGDPARDRVELDAMQRGSRAQVRRHEAEEIARADGRFEHAPAVEAQAAHGVPHRLDDFGAGVVRVARRRRGCAQFLGR